MEKVKGWFDSEQEEQEVNFKESVEEKIVDDELSNFISENAKEWIEQSKKIKEEMMIDDIIAIYNHRYETYEEYFEKQKRFIEATRNLNQKATFFEKSKCGFITIVEPFILTEETFNYIMKRGIFGNENE